MGRAWSHREAAWSSGGVAAVLWVYYNKNVFKDPFGYYCYYYQAALYSKDVSSTTSGTNIFSLLDVNYDLMLLIVGMCVRKGATYIRSCLIFVYTRNQVVYFRLVNIVFDRYFE